MNTTIAILGLAGLILFHEAGHFLVARAVGMRPRRFYLGFPPALVKVERGGVEYGIGAIPLGGYVKIPGMHRPASADLETHFGRVLHDAPGLIGPMERIRRRLVAGDFTGAREDLPALEAGIAASRLSPDAQRAAEKGLDDLSDALGEDAYWRQKTWKRIAVIFAGPGTNLLFAVVLFTVLFMIGGGKATRTVDSVLPDRPAASAGLRAADRILEIDAVPVTPGEIPKRISSSGGRPLTLTVQRDGRIVTVGPVRPVRDAGAWRLGLVLRGRGLAAPSAALHSVKLTAVVTKEIGRSLGSLVHRSGRKQISSPVGIVQGSTNALHQGVQTYLWVLGLISLSLALLNLLPLLPLDGGHIAFSVVEGLRGRAVGREVYERVSAIGLALVLLLFFVGLSNDVGRLGGG